MAAALVAIDKVAVASLREEVGKGLLDVPNLGTFVPNMGTTNKEGLSSALFGKSRRAVLALFYGRPDESFYVREAFRQTGLSQGAVQRELKGLTDVGILVRTERGRQVFYQANTQCPIFEELRSLMTKTAGLADVLRRALSPLGDGIELALIYGSQAKGTASAGSDVDLLIVAGVDETTIHRAVSEAEDQLHRPVNYSLMDRKEFDARRKEESGFVSRVLKGEKIFIIGAPRDT